jgi:beta-galactosidase
MRFHRSVVVALTRSLFLILAIPLIAGLGLMADPYTPPPNDRVDFNFNADWKFLKQDDPNASQVDYNDTTWKTVSLPHTYNDDKFREWISTRNDEKGESHYYGLTWYRKHFTIDPKYAGKKIIVEFQGITLVAKFYINGQALGIYESGTAPCGIDISDYVKFGSDNVLAVQVDNDPNVKATAYNNAKLPFGEPFNPNFGGLNRDVVLHIADRVYQTYPLYLNLGTVGTYIYTTNLDTLNETGDLNIESEVINDNKTEQKVTCTAVVVDHDGNQVLTLSADPQTLAPGQKTVFKMKSPMTKIHLWSPDFPYLYKVYSILSVDDKPVDVLATNIGVRQFTFSPEHGLEINGHPIYLKGYAPRTSMEWPCIGTPVDWMNEYDFKMIKESNGNFVRPMHISPRPIQVKAADKFGVVMVVPAANNEGDTKDADIWHERLDDMRDATIYYRNDPSVLFYEGCNQILTTQHITDMKNVRLTWDPYGGRWAGLRSNDDSTTLGVREYSCTMDGAEFQTDDPLWDAEYGRGECPRRVWDEYTPMLNPRWDGKDPTKKYITGGYFAIASDYHQGLGLNAGSGDFIGDYIKDGKLDFGYFRLQSSEDMVLENLAKYWARYSRSAFIQSPADAKANGVMVGGAKIIWSDSVTDGRMRDTEVARVSGAVDGARLPKEVFYGMQVAQNPNPQVYVVGHWNYPKGTVKRVYVVSNTAQVKLQTFDPAGNLIKDYGFGKNDFAAPVGDQINHYCYAFDNVEWQPGSIKATGYDDKNNVVATEQKSTAGDPAALKLTPILGPSGKFFADGSDVAMFDVEVVDAKGNRCPTFEDSVDFTCSGEGIFSGGYNSGIRYSTNVQNLTSGYHLNLECGINRVFVRATRKAGPFTLNVTRAGLTPATQTITSTPVEVTDGLMTQTPQIYTVALGDEPTPMKADGAASETSVESTAAAGAAPEKEKAPAPVVIAAATAPATIITNFAYSGAHSDAEVTENAQKGTKVYKDNDVMFDVLPAYLAGAEFVRPYQSDAGETSSTDQYQFDVSRFCYVYLLIDSANDMPVNNNNETYKWQKLPETVPLNGRTMTIYKSRLMLPNDNVYLATNGHGISRFDLKSNMYLVMVVSAEQQLQKPGMTITASSVDKNDLPALAIDGDPKTRWTAASDKGAEWIKLDLGQPCAISSYLINWYKSDKRAYRYLIELSDDDKTYTTSLDQQANASKGDAEFLVPPAKTSKGRYVRITITGGGRPSILELHVRGVPASMLSGN